jgi:hypothetical protein
LIPLRGPWRQFCVQRLAVELASGEADDDAGEAIACFRHHVMIAASATVTFVW